MEHEDKLILNYDEYGKTVLDYIFEFKNYKFLKYLLEENLIWFTDEGSNIDGINFGAGTSISRRHFDTADYGLQQELFERDELRTNAIALAIENEDEANEFLDAFRARECPALKNMGFHVFNADLEADYNPALIKTVAAAPCSVLEYFSKEFYVEDFSKHSSEYIFPFLGDVINEMLLNQRTEVEIPIHEALEHNRKVIREMSHMLKEGSREDIFFNPSKELVSIFQSVPAFKGYKSNLICIGGESKNPQIQDLIDEVNNCYEAVLALKGDRNE